MSADNNISQQSISTLVDTTLNKHSKHMYPNDQLLGRKLFYSDSPSSSVSDSDYNSFLRDSSESELQFYKQLTFQTNNLDVYNTVNNLNVINESRFSNITSEEYKMVKIYKDILFHLVPYNIRDYVINFLDLTEVWNGELIKYRITEFQTL